MHWITDIHTHSKYSCDGVDSLSDMLAAAQKKGVAFYGVSEHFDFELIYRPEEETVTDAESYFHAARHLQEDYEGVMNVLVGVEFGFRPTARSYEQILAICKKYRPDFIVNSIHSVNGVDYYYQKPYYRDGVLRPQKEVYEEYLTVIEESLDAPYPYDIVGHIGYACRYAPYENKTLRVCDYQEQIDRILKKIIQKGKILEVNASSSGLDHQTLPSYELVQRYFELGGRLISYGSDAHACENIACNREEITAKLKQIGFTHITIPFHGDYIKVEL